MPSEQGGTLFDNLVDITSIVVEDNFNKCGKVSDPTEWKTSAATVNAFYNPQNNTITFPAAILQEPFYSRDYSVSRNLGAIGFFIGHEITHAFDPMGGK